MIMMILYILAAATSSSNLNSRLASSLFMLFVFIGLLHANQISCTLLSIQQSVSLRKGPEKLVSGSVDATIKVLCSLSVQ